MSSSDSTDSPESPSEQDTGSATWLKLWVWDTQHAFNMLPSYPAATRNPFSRMEGMNGLDHVLIGSLDQNSMMQDAAECLASLFYTSWITFNSGHCYSCGEMVQ